MDVTTKNTGPSKSSSTSEKTHPLSSSTTARKDTGPGQTTSDKSTATRNQTAGRHNPSVTKSQKAPVMTTMQPVTTSSRHPSALRRNDPPFRGNWHEIRKGEDRLNDFLANHAQSMARVIYWSMRELEDWPKVDDVGAVKLHNVVFASESVSYPVSGSETIHHYRSAGHSADASTWFENLYKRSDVIKATPNANQSLVLYDKGAFRTLDTSRLQSDFRSHHILITNKSYTAPKFNKAALINVLHSESKPFPIIYYSEPQKTPFYQRVKGLLDQVESDDGTLKKSGRIYTIYKTPTMDGPLPDLRIATDIQAFYVTVDRPLCHRRAFPISGTQWATISTPHAIQGYQDGGLGTYIYVEIGFLFLFIAKSDTDDEFPLCTKSFDQQTFDVALLAPGSTIYLRPSTVCYSVSSTACVIRGGHFMSRSTLRTTALGILSTFDMLSEQTTSSLDMIRYIVTMFHANWVIKDEEEHLVDHLPDIETFDGILDVFHICIIAEMGAVLYSPRYQGDVVNYSVKHRMSFIHCRALAHQILRHLDTSYQLTSLSGQRNEISTVYLKFLVQQVQVFWLQQTKTHPSSNNAHMFQKDLDAIAEAIVRCFHGKEWFWKVWAECNQPENQSSLRYGYHGENYTVVPPIRIIQSGRPISQELLDSDKEMSLEEEDDNDQLALEIWNRMAEMKAWAKTQNEAK